MYQDFKLDGNNLSNGYIYKKLSERIEIIEKKYDNITTLLEQSASELNISVKEYIEIINKMKEFTTNDEFDKHINDNRIHNSQSFFVNNIQFVKINSNDLKKLVEIGEIQLVEKDQTSEVENGTKIVCVTNVENVSDLYKLDFSTINNGDLCYIKEMDDYYISVFVYIKIENLNWKNGSLIDGNNL